MDSCHEPSVEETDNDGNNWGAKCSVLEFTVLKVEDEKGDYWKQYNNDPDWVSVKYDSSSLDVTNLALVFIDPSDRHALQNN